MERSPSPLISSNAKTPRTSNPSRDSHGAVPFAPDIINARTTMHLNRRQLVAGALAAAARPALAAKSTYAAKPRTSPSMDDLARVAAQPILKRDRLTAPVIIQ